MDKTQILKRVVYIDVGELDDKPGPFCMSFGFGLENLSASIRTAGLINMPLIRRTGSGSIDIVAGYRRILALKALNWDKKVPCIDLSGQGLSDKDLFILNFCDNLCTRKFNNIEKSMILNRLLNYHPVEEIYRSYMSQLDITSRREADLLIKMEELDHDSREIMARDTLSIKTIESLFELDIPSQKTALKWISKLKLNTNQQVLFIDYINDISIRDGKSIEEILGEEGFEGLLMSWDQNTPQKAKRFIDLLRSRRMPLLTDSEKAFAGQLSGLGLPENVRIRHSPFFENPDYLLEISFRDGVKLVETINTLAGIKGLLKIKDPWKV